MSNIEYDLDTSGGLMAQVQTLIAPPVSEENKNKKAEKVEHPYFKHPGRGHNHDSCDACSEGGDLICCDKCPASFHLACHEPPLDVADIPAGQWLCPHCRRAQQLGAEPEAPAGPMQLLVRAASLLNPRQFELPREMSVPCTFPGTDKGDASQRPRPRPGRKKPPAPTPHAAQPAHVPPAARLCAECRRSCRVAPLLACDYCPQLFHLDCLRPPLTALPQGRWMCPAHAQHALDAKLLSSVSVTERVRLWDRFSGPVDQEAVKVEFMRKVHCRNPPFRFKVRLAPRHKTPVPDMVRQHYRRPAPLLPALRDVLRLEAAAARSRHYLECVAAASVLQPSPDRVEPDAPLNGLKDDELNGCKRIKLPDVVAGPVLHADIERELSSLDTRLLHLLAYQRIQHLLSSLSPAGAAMPLPSELLTPADIDRISRVFTSPKRPRQRSRSSLRARAMLCPVVSKHFYNVRTSEVDPAQVRHDASFMGFRPTVSARFPEAAAMRYRSLSIGRGAANDVELERFGHCNYTSPKHAVIFYDECTKHYELINYSEHGTQVNNILYSCDTSSSGGPAAAQPARPAGAAASVRELLERRRRGARARRAEPEARMSACAADSPECSCAPAEPAEPAPAQGWEGAALLAHGALLRFGCVTFVFSIVECATL